MSAIDVLAPAPSRSRPTLSPFFVAPAPTTIVFGAAAASAVVAVAPVAGDEIERRVMRGDVRIAEHDRVVEGAADRHRPALDAPGLAHEAVAVEALEQRQRLG